jgi:hypothetical protein
VTDTRGNLDVPFNVPNVEAGTYDVEVRDTDGNLGEFKFTLTTTANISPATSQASPGYPSMEVTIYGTGFKPNSAITLTYTSTATVFSTTSQRDGSFAYTFEIPKNKPGENIISVTDGVNLLQVTFFMESVAPTTPQLLLPAPATKPERPVIFDWKDIIDPSGVTYILQVARGKNFTDIVIEKQGLVESQYTMSQTEDEMLESINKVANYWWRVKAVDGASNESKWSNIRSFDIGFVAAMADWLKYLLIGIAVVVLSSIAFFVGRKTGHTR